jgi:two-component sensor histidine kinase
MQINRSSIFLEVIEGLSKSVHIGEGNAEAMAKEILFSASHFLKINRVNTWLIDEDFSKLTCLSAYDRSLDTFYDEGVMLKENYPVYFNHISRTDIIISTKAQEEPFNSEIVENYLVPKKIFSMMEVPILSGGKFKGIVCFENTNEVRIWTNDEQHFALALTQLLILTLETKEKNIYRDELEKLVKEKSVLIAEINHRVKNNLAVITALIRNESFRVKDDFHKELFNNILLKTFSLSTLQHAIYNSQNYQEANFSEFIRTLVANMNDTYGHNLTIKLELDLEELNVEIDKAVPCSLIVNEILTNCYKYAFSSNRENMLSIQLHRNLNQQCELTIKDNGTGLPEHYATNGTGFDLMEGLTDQIDGVLMVDSNKNGTSIKLIF